MANNVVIQLVLLILLTCTVYHLVLKTCMIPGTVQYKNVKRRVLYYYNNIIIELMAITTSFI